MALQHQLWGHTERPWGYEVRIDVQDSVSGEHYPLCLTWWREQGVPDKAAIEAEAQRRVAVLEAKLLEPPEEPEVVYTDSEIAEALKKKGYTATRIEDLPVATVEPLDG